MERDLVIVSAKHLQEPRGQFDFLCKVVDAITALEGPVYILW